jgi:hypothetical protein
MIKLSSSQCLILQSNIFKMFSGNILEYLKARPVRSHSHSDPSTRTDQHPSRTESLNLEQVEIVMANADSISRPAPAVVASRQSGRGTTRVLGTGNVDNQISQPSPRNLLRWGCLKMTPAHPESRGECRTACNEDRVSRSQEYAGPTKA